MSIDARAGPRHTPGHEATLDLPIPFGWFALAFSSDLEPGDVQPLYVFDEHLVLFRTDNGVAHATAAFCPHLGAHLGHGGRVEGDHLVCPFHAKYRRWFSQFYDAGQEPGVRPVVGSVS